MIPLVDMHCHLLAGVDDGPRTEEEALEMCRIAWEEGIRLSVALAHQNERWQDVTPELIRERTRRLADTLVQAGVSLCVFPCAEVMVHPKIETSWQRGDLLSIADRGQYLLIEMPRGLFVDLREIIKGLRQKGVRPILAHPEQQPELLHESGRIEQFIQAGCLVQVSSGNITDPATRAPARDRSAALSERACRRSNRSGRSSSGSTTSELPTGNGVATLSWEAPTTTTTGETLTNLAGYKIYYGVDENDLSESVSLNSVGVETYVIENLGAGTWYFAIKAVTAAGAESSLSNIVSKTIS